MDVNESVEPLVCQALYDRIRRAFNMFGKGIYGFVIENKSRPDEMKMGEENQMITFPEAMLKELDIMSMMEKISLEAV